jgi:hypothetical protein
MVRKLNVNINQPKGTQKMKLVTWSTRFYSKVDEYKALSKEEGLMFLNGLQRPWADGGLTVPQSEIREELTRNMINLSMATLEVVRIKLEQELSAKKTTDDLLSKYMLKA